MGENREDTGGKSIWINISILISFIFWLIGILAILASLIGTISSLTGAYSNSEFWAIYISEFFTIRNRTSKFHWCSPFH